MTGSELSNKAVIKIKELGTYLLSVHVCFKTYLACPLCLLVVVVVLETITIMVLFLHREIKPVFCCKTVNRISCFSLTTKYLLALQTEILYLWAKLNGGEYFRVTRHT